MQIIWKQTSQRVQNMQWTGKQSQINAGHTKTSLQYDLQVPTCLIFTSFIFHHYIFLDISYLALPRIGKLMGRKGKTSGVPQNLSTVYVTTSNGIKDRNPLREGWRMGGRKLGHFQLISLWLHSFSVRTQPKSHTKVKEKTQLRRKPSTVLKQTEQSSSNPQKTGQKDFILNSHGLLLSPIVTEGVVDKRSKKYILCFSLHDVLYMT